MRKLTLDPHALRVESFDPSAGGTRTAGTVLANDATSLCSGQATCAYTYCQATCYCPYTTPQPTCGGGCATVDPARCP